MIRDNSTLNTQHSTLLFIHGWATDSWVWENQVKEFSKDYNVISIDLPGYDTTRVKGQKACFLRSRVKDRGWFESTLTPAVEKVLRFTKSPLPPFSKVGDRGIIGIGWSLGASVLMSAAVKYPELFSLFSWDPYGRQAIVFLCGSSILLLTHFNSGIDFV